MSAKTKTELNDGINLVGLLGLIENGSDVNMTLDQQSALSVAASVGDHQTVEYLINKGADINYTSVKGQPLFRAVESGHTECVRILLKAGADVNITHNGNSLRNVAWDLETIKLLMVAGVDINKTNRQGRTELHVCVLGSEKIALVSFLEAGADIDTVDHNGQTVLHYAAQQGNDNNDNNGDNDKSHIMEILLKYNPDNTIRDKSGKLAIEYATDPIIINLLTTYEYFDMELKEPDEIYMLNKDNN